MKIVITGASGFIGSEIITYFQDAGVEILLVGRDRARLAVKYPAHKTTDYDTLAQDAVGYDAILHMAVKNNDQSGSPDDFKAVNVDLLDTVVMAACHAKVGCFVNLTTLHAASADIKTAYARSKRDADALLARQTDINVINIRLPAVYGGTYKGKLSILNSVPSILRPATFQMLAALKPTVHIRHVFNSVMVAVTQKKPGDVIVTDRQTGNIVYTIAKKTIDIGFVLCVALLLWWVLIVAWIAVKYSSSGPGIFAQARVGRDGKIFNCYKFRTMQVGTRQTGTHDVDAKHITKVGHFLRRTKIDELPQIVNILKNEMTLIGPRPCLPVQTDLIEERRKQGVLQVLGGISGLAQIQNVDMSDPVRLAKLDAEYVALRSIPLDFKIIIATATGRGQGDKTRPDSTAE